MSSTKATIISSKNDNDQGKEESNLLRQRSFQSSLFVYVTLMMVSYVTPALKNTRIPNIKTQTIKSLEALKG